MIKVEAGHSAGYLKNDPVITVHHQISKDIARGLLPLIIEQLGADEVNNALRDHVTAVEKGEFVCLIDRGPLAMAAVPSYPSSTVYEYLPHAVEAAAALAKQTGLTTFVLRKVATAEVTPVTVDPLVTVKYAD